MRKIVKLMTYGLTLVLFLEITRDFGIAFVSGVAIVIWLDSPEGWWIELK